MHAPAYVNLGASLVFGLSNTNLTRSLARPRCCPPRAWTRGCAPDCRFLMVDTSWDRPGVDPESFFEAPEEQVASSEQSPTTSSKIQSSEWENSELGKVMQSLSERPALVGRVRLLIACLDLGVLKRLSTLAVIQRQSGNGMPGFFSPSRAASPSLVQGGQLVRLRARRRLRS